MSRLLVCLAWCVAGVALGAETPQAQLLSRLHEPAVLRGSFVQERQIAGFKKPVQSGGRFLVARGTGLVWHTMRPFESLLVINRDHLRVSNGAGQPGMELDATKEPMMRTLNDLLQAVVVADLSMLQKQFDVETNFAGSADWSMKLRPREAALRARFASIDLAGDAHVRTVRLQEQSGDVTTVRFSEQTEDVHLTDAEAGQLR